MDDRIIRTKIEAIRRSAVIARWPVGPWQARTADFAAVDDYRFDDDWAEIAAESFWPAGKTLFIRITTATPPDVPLEDLFLQFDAEGLEGLLTINGRPYAGIDANHLRVLMPEAGTLRLEAEFVCLLAALHRAELRRERARLREVSFVQIDRAIETAYYDLWFTYEASQHVKDARRKQLLHAALEAALLAVDLTAPRDEYRLQVIDAGGILAQRIDAIAPDPEAGRIYLTGHSHIDTAWLWPLRETVRKCSRTFATAARLMERYPDYRFSCSQPQLYAYTKKHYPALYAEVKKWVATGRWECTGGPWVESDCNVPSGEALIRQMLHGLRFFREEFGARPHSLWLPDVFGYPASLPQILAGCGLPDFYTNKLHWQARNVFPVNLFWWEGIDGTRVLAHIPKLRNGYNGWPNPEQLLIGWDNFEQKAIYDELLFPFGFGDGGGGPTEEMLEFTTRATSFPGLPACRQGGGEAYFDEVRRRLTVDDGRPTEDGGRKTEDRALTPVPRLPSPVSHLPTWVGELYLETHRGTYTTHSEIKRANRKNELALREAEIAGFMAALSGVPVDLSPLDAAWENLLLLQFHDILPGSSIGEVYREAALDHARTAETARTIRDAAWRAVTERVAAAGDQLAACGELIAFNSLSWPRNDVATAFVPTAMLPLAGVSDCDYADAGALVELVAPDGRAAPAQIIGQRDDQTEIVFTPDELPALGYQRLALRPTAEAAQSSLRVSASARQIENRFFRLELDDEGNLVRLLDKRHGREVVPAGQIANELQLFQDGPEREAAWNIHATFEKRTYAWEPGTMLEVVEAGPVRAVVRITRRYRASAIAQDLILYDRVPRIDFVTRADWQERQVMLKAAFPVAVRSPRASFEIQFGAVERPTHRNTSWDQEKFEVCAHRWADLSEAGYGVSLLNDCKYGHDVHGNVLRVTLLRGPESPDPDADRGQHEFTYALFPHAGDWMSGETVRRGWELNVPVVCVATDDGGRRTDDGRRTTDDRRPTTDDRRSTTNDESRKTRDEHPPVLPLSHSFFTLTGPAILEAIKPAEDGDGWIVRMYEPNGGRGTVTLRSTRPWQQVIACNLVEENGAAMPSDGQSVTFPIGPFEIVALRVRIA